MSYYSFHLWYKIFVKGYGFLSFARNMEKNSENISKNLSRNYSQELLDHARYAFKTA